MEKLFGIPIDPLLVGLVATLGAALLLVAILALRNRVFFKLGLRNAGRRRGRTTLIVFGLMLGTAIVSAALSTGDSMSNTIRSTVIDSLGETDELVSVEGAEAQGFAGVGYFDEELFAPVNDAARADPLVDGVAPAIIEPVAVQNRTTRQNEPRVTLFASESELLDGFGEIREVGAGSVSLGELGPGEAYLNADVAEELSASPGDELRVLAGDRSETYTLRSIVEYDGSAGASEKNFSVLLPLSAAQDLLGKEGHIKHVLVSNQGNALSGARHSEDVISALTPALEPLGLEVEPVKQDALDLADEVGGTFMSFFTTFGTFSIMAGILLIFLIFVMLAAERRSEMGIARAVGTQRGHLVQTFLFEGLLYDLAAAAVGALLGVGVAYGMVVVMARSFGAFGLEVAHDLRPQSILVAYTLGVLLTLVVVALSAWRVSRLNIVTAIRNLPEPLSRKAGRGRWALGLVGVALGCLLTLAGAQGENASPFFLGISLVLISLVPLLRVAGVPDRGAFTFGGLALVILWLLPLSTFDFVLPELGMDFSIFILGGLMVVVGTSWTLMYNADLLLGAVTAVFGRIRALAPVVKLAVAHPLRSRFRTGMTLALFTLVVFTLVVGTTTSNAFNDAFADEGSYAGGFDIRASTAAISPVEDMDAAIEAAPTLEPGAFDLVASQSVVSAEARQSDRRSTFEPYLVRGLDDAFLAGNAYELAALAEGYSSTDDVWRALATEPGLAVVDPIVVPRRDNFNFGVVPDFSLEGFVLEDETFAPVPIEVRDPETGAILELTVIGVLRDTIPEFMYGIATSQETLAPLGDRARPTVHFFRLAEGMDPAGVSAALEAAFLTNGMEADALADELDEAVGASRTFNRIVQGFMGLGLIVGVAALGVISARAVVERRQQIGVLRSIGFQRRMVQLSFLIEASFVSLLAIVVGAGLGLVMAFNVVNDASKQPSWENLTFAVPWLNLAVIFLAVYVAALAATFVPSRRASRIYPAEALRYE